MPPSSSTRQSRLTRTNQAHESKQISAFQANLILGSAPEQIICKRCSIPVGSPHFLAADPRQPDDMPWTDRQYFCNPTYGSTPNLNNLLVDPSPPTS
jgi:hypothetical protein